MTTTVRAYKGLMTKRSQVALAWLGESAQRLQSSKDKSTQQEQVKEYTMAVARCDEYLQLLEASLTKLTEAFDKLQDTTDEEEDQLDKHAEIAQETIMKLYAHKSNVTQMLQEITTGITLRTSGTDHQCSAALSKLPTIPIPTFTGKKWEWDNFWAIFKANVHDQDLTELQKFNYLLSSLSGEAKQSISRFFVSSSNYEKAIQHLAKRYGNKDGIILELNKSLRNCVARGPSTADQRQLWDKLSAIAAQLEEHEQHLSNQITIQIFLQKFHVRVRKAAMEKRLKHKEENNREWTLDQWLNAIDDIISQEEQINHMLSVDIQTRNSSYQNTMAMKVPSEPTGRWKASNLCECCGGNGHRWINCSQIPTAAQKKSFLLDTGRCLNCGSIDHRVASCFSGNCQKCGKKHHTATCSEQKPGESAHDRSQRSQQKKTEPQRTFKNQPKTPAKPYCSSRQHVVTESIGQDTHNITQGATESAETPTVLQLKKGNGCKQNRVVLLAGAVQVLDADGNKRDTVVLLDTGSELSFIGEELANELKLPTLGTASLELSTFGSPAVKTKTCAKTILKMMDKEGTQHEVQLYKNDYITSSVQRASLDPEDLKFIKEGRYDLSLPIEGGELRPQILLGCDYLWNFMESCSSLNLPSGLHLIPTKLGYIVSGRREGSRPRLAVSCTLQGHETEKETWDRYWSLESTGTEEYTGPQKTELQKTNEKVLESFKESIEKREDGYYVRLPWKDNHQELPDNKALAMKRLAKILEMYQKDPKTLQAYDDIFKEQQDKGIIEEVTSEDNDVGEVIHYLPHQAVITPSKETTKMRIVFDASAHYKDCHSLNDVLHQGPLILPDLVGILLRFRMHSIAVMSDIEKAFLQVRLQEKDRDATRCIWVRNISRPPTPDNIVIYRFTRVTFGINASPFLLSATIDHHLETTASDDYMAPEIRRNLYVDNLFFGAQSSKEALMKYAHTKKLFEELKMNLREFCSNDKTFYSAIDDADKMKSTCPKVLGITWNSETDKLIIKGSMATLKSKDTKRTVTQQLASVYDPMGFLVPLLLPAKIFMQSLWKEGLDWDTPLPAQLRDQWHQITSEISTFYKEVDRRILRSDGHRLVVFTDASQCAIAACAYLTSQEESNIIMAKSKLPSIKTSMTIPKLEMNALTLGVRMSRFVCEALEPLCNIKEVILYTDSDIVLGWIQTPPSRQSAGVLVTNRLSEIRRISNDLRSRNTICLFGHVSTAENPADCGTRGLSSEAFQNHFWWTGPDFTNKPDYSKLNAIKDSETTMMSVEAVTAEVTERKSNKGIVDLTRFSTLERAQRVLVYVLRFIHRSICHLPPERRAAMQQHIQALKGISLSQTITGVEMQESRMCLIRDHQKNFVDEHQIKSQKDLNIRQDEKGILRCYGRLQQSDAPITAKTPIYIAPKTALARLIISEIHNNYHRGVAHTMATVRETYWIPKLRQQVRSLIQKCVPCQKMNNLPFTYPDMEAMPATRVHRARPFEHIGLDYFGPLTTSDNHEGSNKAYGCIFTCQVTRLIHLELVGNMSTEAFLNALRRFFARRGVPQTITCDNAPTFLLGEQILKDATENMVNSTEVGSEIARREIKWNHITPYAPWQGGFYERLIRSIKNSLYKTLGVRTISFDGLRTMLAEIEAVLNSRPLTYQEEKWEEQPILRPIDFIQNEMTLDYPLEYIGKEGQDKVYHTPEEAQQLATQRQVEAALKTSIDLTEKFWKVWTEQYLTSLREQHKIRMNERRGTRKSPKEGDIVLLWDAVQPRNTWRTARIVQVDESPHKATREVVVETPTKRRLRRPINRVVLLEVDKEETTKTSTPLKVPTTRYNLRSRRPINYNEDEEQEPTHRKTPAHPSPVTSLLTVALLSLCVTGTAGLNKSSSYQLQCIQGGVSLVQPNQQPYEICAEDFCMEFKEPHHQEIVRFPPQITLHEHLVKWKIFDGEEVYLMETTCKAAPFCEQIDCTFCAVMVSNPECWPRTAILVTGLLVYLAITVCYCLFHVPVLLGTPILYGLKLAGMCGWLMFRLLCRLLKIVTGTDRRRRRRAWTRNVVLLTILCISEKAAGCQDVDLLTHQTQACTQSGEEEYCTVDTTEILKINPFKQEACMRLTSNNTNILELKVVWKNLDLFCEKETLLFSRSTRYALLDSKRCPHAGSCTGDKCAGIHRTSKVKELQRVNDYPGVTGCVESCGGPGCDCFYPSSGCLFYRIYLVPTDDRVYEIFRCPRWKQAVHLRMTVSEQGSVQHSHDFQVIPNQPKNISSFTITLSSLSTPPTPALNSIFLTDGRRYATVEAHQEPPLVCKTWEDAQNLTCDVYEDCKCAAAETKMMCDCKEVNLASLISTPRHQLPIIRPNLEFRTIDERITARIPQLPTAEFILRMRSKVRITALRSDAICSVENTYSTGCYNCAKGAIASLICRASIAATKAEVQCEDSLFVIPCSQEGTETNVTFVADKAQFHRNCTVQCGKVQTIFEISGILHYAGSLNMAARRVLHGESELFSEINLPDFSHLAQTFLMWYSVFAATALVVIVALVLTYFYASNACVLSVIRTVCRIIYAMFTSIFQFLMFLVTLPYRCLRMLYSSRKKKPEEKNL